MSGISMEQIRELREATGAGMMDCRRALEEAGGDLQEAIDILRKKGFDQAAKRAGRETGNGVVEAYLHRTSEDYPPQMGALVELNCETDFVAKGPEFRRLARELAMHVTAANPRYVSREEVPPEVVEEELAQVRRRAEQNGGDGAGTSAAPASSASRFAATAISRAGSARPSRFSTCASNRTIAVTASARRCWRVWPNSPRRATAWSRLARKPGRT